MELRRLILNPAVQTANVMPVNRQAQAAGTSSLRAIAEILNNRGVSTARGGILAATQVRDILKRSVPA